MLTIESTLAQLLPSIQATLKEGGEYLLCPRGESMLPLIRPARDSVYLVAPDKLKRHDVCLYQRENGQFVLHRLVKIEKDGTLTFRGDNQSAKERGIPQAAVIARVGAVLRDGKRVSPQKRLYLFTHIFAPARLLRFGKI